MKPPAFEQLEPRTMLDAVPHPWVPGPPPGARIATVAENTVDVEVAQAIPAEPQGAVTAPLLIDAHGNRVCAASVRVRYNPAELDLSLADVRKGTVWTGDAWHFLSTVLEGSGEARIIWYSSEFTVTHSGVLAYLDFTVAGAEAGDEIVLDVEPFLPYEGGLNWRGHDGSIAVLPAGRGPTPGDANLDGRVDYLDLGILATNYGERAGWLGGDFNFDSAVDFMDLAALATRYGT